MAGDRDDRDSTAPGFIQTDLYGHSFEAQLPDSLTKGSRRRAPALSRRELLKRAGGGGRGGRRCAAGLAGGRLWGHRCG